VNRRGFYVLGILLLLAFAGFAFTSFQQSLTPYVPFAEAQSSPRTLQVAGALVAGSGDYIEAEESLVFTLAEEASGDTLRVRYHGIKPANFEDAISIVAIGRFDSAAQTFEADKLLVKCPSKYQGVEDDVKEYG